MSVRPLSWACGHGTEMLLILKELFLTWLLPYIFRYDSPKKCPTILYAVNLWLKPFQPLGLVLRVLAFPYGIVCKHCLAKANSSNCYSNLSNCYYCLSLQVIVRPEAGCLGLSPPQACSGCCRCSTCQRCQCQSILTTRSHLTLRHGGVR